MTKTVPTSHFVSCEGLEVHCLEWGIRDRPGVILWHGLARSCRDFDVLAESLSAQYRVLVPDTPGRGLSQWSSAPGTEYCFSFYAKLVESLVDRFDVGNFSWIGTSMGAALGIRVAGGPLSARINRLILNDMGPEPNPLAMARIRDYIGLPPEFQTVSQFETYCREIYRPFGLQSDEQWRHMAMTSMRRLQNGNVTTHYDPKIVRQLVDHPHDFTQWEFFDKIKAPLLLLRGTSSDLVLPDLMTSMQVRQPGLEIIEIEGCGHAPALNVEMQIDLVKRFLSEGTLR